MKSQKRRTRNKPSRSSVQFWHTKMRARERFNKILLRREYNELIIQIKENKFEYLGKYSNSRSLFLAFIWAYPIVLLYDKSRHTIATILRPSMVRWDELKDRACIK